MGDGTKGQETSFLSFFFPQMYLFITIVCGCFARTHIWAPHVYSACRGQKNSLGLELHSIINQPVSTGN